MSLAAPWSYPAPQGARAGTVEVALLRSDALAGNPLGDPDVRHTPVYLPPGHNAHPDRRYPVVYWLHGFTGTAMAGLAWRPWEPSLPELMDRASAATGREAILVLVDGFTRYGGSQYVNSSYNGRYEDYLVHDVVSFIDARYRTLAEPAGRVIAGKSSGGYGALVLGMRHPDVFGGLASISGDAYFELCFKPDFPKALELIARHGGGDAGVRAFLDALLAAPRKSGEYVAALSSVFAMAMAYSPNADSALGFDLPFDPHTGELRPDVWAHWEAADPVHMAPRCVDNLRRLRLIYFEAGTRDEFNLQYGARILSRRLEQLGITHQHVEFDDGHPGVNYRYEPLFRLLLERLPQ
ncbi:MAG: putative esterase [uncultured Chloroflexi bacterium]|uniref:Putative esterase n=1 Tax=uncultured Chloroflexota bacterium TaxID=166587 RepID=A0A6J4KJJ1_9CHLR|nr:MAG: putative esterase [uncultured Chloroflexota bacterium]